MATGNAMFPGDNQINQLEYIIKLIGNLPENLVKFYNDNPNFNINKLITVDKPETLEKKYEKYLTSDAIDFMKGLLELDPKKRLNAETVFDHKYFECYKKNERNTNNLLFSFSIDERRKIKIPNFRLNDNKKESRVINIFRYNDESFISDTNESTISKKHNLEIRSNLMKSFQNKKRNYCRSDMVDFGEMYLLTEKRKKEREIIEKKEKKSQNVNNNKNISKFRPLKITDNGLNHKKSFSIIKNSNDNNENSASKRSNKNLRVDKFPYLSPILITKQRPIENIKIYKRESKRVNYYSLINELKLENDNNNKIPFINKFIPESKKEIMISRDKSESKIKKKSNIIDYKNLVHKNNYFRSVKMKSFENVINRNKDECITTSKKIINLYENTFKNIISSTKEKRKISPSLPKKRKSVITGIFKNITNKNLNYSPPKKKFELPCIYNFHSNDIININSFKYEKMGKDIFKYDFKYDFYNNRYKINQL